MSEWENIPKRISDYQGFVYIITNLTNNRKYVGKKFFWFMLTRKPLKGKNHKRHELIESDWRTYYGSNKELNEDVVRLGEDCFKREIVCLCKSKFECAYKETELQFKLGVLFDENYYNEVVNCRLRYNKMACKKKKKK